MNRQLLMINKRDFYAIVLFICSTQWMYAQNLEITHGPYLQYLTSNEITINWSTSKNSISWVEYYKEDGSNFYQKEREKIFNASDGLKNISVLHSVTLKNLDPATKYAYRIYSTEVKDDRSFGKTVATQVYKRAPLYFTTQPIKKEQISLLVLSDMHENTEKVDSLLKGVEWDKTDFVLLDGDFVDSFESQSDLYDGVLDTCVDIFAQNKPLVIVRGNHETRGRKAHELKKYFHFPDNKYYYTYTIGTTLFIVLDSGEDKADSDIEYNGFADFDTYRSEQANWLSEVVKSDAFKNAEHKIAFMHIPPYDDNRGQEWHGDLEVRLKFVPILNKAGIDLMVSGHTHHYSFQPPKIEENNFPILVADHKTRYNLLIDKTGIKIKGIDIDSKEVLNMFIEK
ncbi:FN3 domain-containing metallophosphoesterase family protein [Zobellia galactanivorans]|uniref:FN3 domain-containing metallophosphoesterase family protein n=1 Tax=Zobellia galactanivorans (strain DSM 12802 / CCUG 47099 / CIP 106680 / NCIMB 13871 / Dsij) TaxID=63186 RepID=UPI001C06ADA3|nr:FN3 domain-containing metallophosphoesterase family protein [Zobellia galactanivorans]MBU3024703.1 metallophosphoesterase [Zobellia galactanivorans]